MKLKSAMKALGEGRRIRGASWPEDEYIHIFDNEICDEQNKTFYLDFNDSDENWEFYDENE